MHCSKLVDRYFWKSCIFCILYCIHASHFAACFCVRNGTVKPLSDHVASTGGWMAWSTDVLLRRPAQWTYHTLIKRPTLWAYSKLFGGEDDAEDFSRPQTREQIVSSLPDDQFVFIDLIKVCMH